MTVNSKKNNHVNAGGICSVVEEMVLVSHSGPCILLLGNYKLKLRVIRKKPRTDEGCYQAAGFMDTIVGNVPHASSGDRDLGRLRRLNNSCMVR